MIRHILRSQDFNAAFLDRLFERAAWLKHRMADPRKQRHIGGLLSGSLMFSVFYEPSTRTRFSFEAAAKNMGMEVVTTENAKEFSSAAKGETLEDSIQVMCQYQPDVIVLRHFDDDAADRAATVSTVPIINAGSGRGQHPTQALLDLYTIKEELGRTDNLKVVFGGDLANGRTVRSLAYLLSKFPGNQLTFLAPPQLGIGQDIKSHLRKRGVQFSEVTQPDGVFESADVVYWTRLQAERLRDDQKGADQFVITPSYMKRLPKHSILLHPLPRVDEIDHRVDQDPRAAYFRQAGNGMYVRMALLEWVLELEK